MHIYFSGIGGVGIGPLALIAHKAGYEVSGSDLKENLTIKYLRSEGLDNIHIGQSYEQIAQVHAKKPIDWFVYTSALPMDQPDAPEIKFCVDQHIKHSKRDRFLESLLDQKGLQLIGIAGTHGKTTTTAMAIWLCKQVGVPISYSVGARLSFGEMGEYTEGSRYFIYEADEYDRNFLSFHPYIAIITGIDWDHADIYPTRDEYRQAFVDFLGQSQQAILWQSDAVQLDLPSTPRQQILDENDPEIDQRLTLAGHVNRLDAWAVVHALQTITGRPLSELFAHMNRFPGVARRFERIADHIYSDTAHTPPKIRGALQLAHEVGGKNVVVVYEGLHNTRQHFIKKELRHLFDSVKHLYIVPSYLARENKDLPLLTPSDLANLLDPDTKARTTPSALDDQLRDALRAHATAGDLVLCLSDGGSKSLDEWVRREFGT